MNCTQTVDLALRNCPPPVSRDDPPARKIVNEHGVNEEDPLLRTTPTSGVEATQQIAHTRFRSISSDFTVRGELVKTPVPSPSHQRAETPYSFRTPSPSFEVDERLAEIRQILSKVSSLLGPSRGDL